MTNQQMSDLVTKYYDAEGYTFSDGYEHRLDKDSSSIMYSLIREYKPKSCLEIGPWLGGSSCIIMTALQKNGGDFTYHCSELDDSRRAGTWHHVLEKCGRAPQMLGDVTQELINIPEKLDFAFIDTDHDLATTEWIVDNIFPRLKKGALLVFHDWAVTDVNGEWTVKDGGWPETQYLCDLHKQGKFNYKKIFWTWKNPFREGVETDWETGVWQT